jgi:hypothetical protein
VLHKKFRLFLYKLKIIRIFISKKPSYRGLGLGGEGDLYCKYVYIELYVQYSMHKNTCLLEIFQYNRNNSVASDIFLEVGRSPAFILCIRELGRGGGGEG